MRCLTAFESSIIAGGNGGEIIDEQTRSERVAIGTVLGIVGMGIGAIAGANSNVGVLSGAIMGTVIGSFAIPITHLAVIHSYSLIGYI